MAWDSSEVDVVAAADWKAARLGLGPNWPQFALLVLVNAFVGAMVGLERTVLPALAEAEFALSGHAAMLAFIVVFGVSKALTNYAAGRLSDRVGRKPVLVAGWLLALPVAPLLMWAPTWGWVLAANALLGVSQGLTWSTTVIMKVDLAGPRRRGLAMGLNEFAGYLAVAVSAWATGVIAVEHGLRPAPFWLGVGFSAAGLLLSAFVVKETLGHARAEARAGQPAARRPPQPAARRDLVAIFQAGCVNNLNDGMAWGLFPVVFAAARMSLADVGLLAAIYPAVWGLAQLATGALSDRHGRKWFIAGGMVVQAAGLALVAFGKAFEVFAVGAVLLGLGTAMVYPTLLAAIGDVASPENRATTIGAYRLWRDLGYAAGALIAGLVADWLGLTAAVLVVAGLTFASGLQVAVALRETLRRAS
jgi:MFS family permease